MQLQKMQKSLSGRDRRGEVLRLVVWLLVLAAGLGTANLARAQSLSGILGNKPAEATARGVGDALGRTTPRSAILNFLQACHAERYVLAARYLDVRKIPADRRQIEGADLAKHLADILDREPHFEVDRLNDNPEGNLRDSHTPDLEKLIEVDLAPSPTTLELQRIKQQGVEVWLVSADSVARIADLDALEGATEIEKRMPGFLLRNKILGTPLWAWILLVIVTLLLLLFSRLLSRLFLLMLAPVAKRFAKSLQSYRLESLTDPLRLLISLAVFRLVMQLFTPSALLREYLIRILAFLSTIGFAALAVRLVDLSSAQVQNRLGPAERALSYSVLPLGVRFIRILIFLIAALVILASWGYNTNAILAGLGVGGLAVALAAQKTIENLFGAVALISDRPVLVGDACQFGSQSGTVEDIGLRSTRIRTADRTLVTIPNSNFSTMTIENFSRRDRIWFHPTLRLRRDTSPSNVKEMMSAAAAVLQSHPLVQPAAVPIRFTKITDYSLDLEIFAYVATANFDEFLTVQSALLLGFLEASQRTGVGFAIPLTESVSVNPEDSGQTGYGGSRPDASPQEEPRQQD